MHVASDCRRPEHFFLLSFPYPQGLRVRVSDSGLMFGSRRISIHMILDHWAFTSLKGQGCLGQDEGLEPRVRVDHQDMVPGRFTFTSVIAHIANFISLNSSKWPTITCAFNHLLSRSGDQFTSNRGCHQFRHNVLHSFETAFPCSVTHFSKSGCLIIKNGNNNIDNLSMSHFICMMVFLFIFKHRDKQHLGAFTQTTTKFPQSV